MIFFTRNIPAYNQIFNNSQNNEYASLGTKQTKSIFARRQLLLLQFTFFDVEERETLFVSQVVSIGNKIRENSLSDSFNFRPGCLA